MIFTLWALLALTLLLLSVAAGIWAVVNKLRRKPAAAPAPVARVRVVVHIDDD